MEEVCSILLAAGFDEAAVEIFRVNKINRSVLLDLDKDDIKELGVTALGDRKKLLAIIAKLREESDPITSKNFVPCMCGNIKLAMFSKSRPHEILSTSSALNRVSSQLNSCDNSLLAPGPSHLPLSIVETHPPQSGATGSPSSLLSNSEDEYSSINRANDVMVNN